MRRELRDGRLRRDPRARADHARWSAGTRACFDSAPGGRHVPRLFLELAPERDRPRPGRDPALQPAARPDRGLRGRALDRRALLRRQLRGDPERGRSRRGADRAQAAGQASSGSCSSGARRSARGCPCCCPRSPGYAGTSRPGSTSWARRPSRSSRCSPRSKAAWSRWRPTGTYRTTELWRQLHGADVLCAPSLGGESFGMVLTEAFAAGTPVVASDIAGYRQVVTHGRDGVLVPHGRPLELAEALRALWLDPGRRQEMGIAARRRADDFAWPRVAERVAGVYEQAIAAPEPAGAMQRVSVQSGFRQARHVAAPARTAPPVDRARTPARSAHPPSPRARGRPPRGARDLGRARPAARRSSRYAASGFENVVSTLVRSSPSWVLIALALFSTLDGPEGGLLVRDRPRRPAGPAGQATHDPERHGDRRADVGDAARPPR